MKKESYLLLFLFFLIPIRGICGIVNFPETILLTGELAQRIHLTQKRLANHPFSMELLLQDVARLPGHERRFEEYEGDISGRVLSAWSYSARLLNQRPAKLDALAGQILQYQNPDGSFGRNQQPDGWDYWGRQLWGHGRLLVGLVEYYKLSRDAKFLKSAEKLGDYLVAGMGQWDVSQQGHHWFTNYTSLLESLMLLYEISPQPKYLDAGEKIAELIPDFGYYHSHGYLISLVGMARLYQFSGNSMYAERLNKIYWQQLMRHTHQADGSVSEWFPVNARTEGCSIVDWLRLNLSLWQLTKNPVYLATAEKTWLNALNFHQTGNGAFGHTNFNSLGYSENYHESWWCCLMHGLFGYAEVARHCVVSGEDSLWINFYAPFSANLKLDSGNVHVQVETDYPNSGKIRVQLAPKNPSEFTLHLRIPSWAADFQVQVNEQILKAAAVSGDLQIRRTWKSGDVVELNLPLKLRVEDHQENPVNFSVLQPDRIFTVSFFCGPLILGCDTKYNAAFPDVIFYQQKKEYLPNSAEETNNSFGLPNVHFRLPAETGQQETTVLLVPISEQTGYSNWTDELQNFIATGEAPVQRVPVRFIHTVEWIK